MRLYSCIATLINLKLNLIITKIKKLLENQHFK